MCSVIESGCILCVISVTYSFELILILILIVIVIVPHNFKFLDSFSLINCWTPDTDTQTQTPSRVESSHSGTESMLHSSSTPDSTCDIESTASTPVLLTLNIHQHTRTTNFLYTKFNCMILLILNYFIMFV